MPEKILFVFMHGWKGTANSLFIPLLREKLNIKGYESASVTYPHADNPVYAEWKETFLNLISDVWTDQKIVLCGHSLGGYTIMRILGECADDPWAKSVIGAVTVGGVTIKDRKPYYNAEIEWNRIKRLGPRVVCIHSEDDPYVGIENMQHMCEMLKDMPTFEKKLCNGFAHFQMKEAEPITEVIMSFAL